MEDVLKRIHDYALEEIMGDRFGKYAKEIIQDRAIPDVRDGLKPVQRRILYAMYKAGNVPEKGYIKCAATVGDVLGKFHPHGDSSVYDAMVRMSQWWKQNHILIDIHGNNGSMDGDSAAAYRYTESRLAKISMELLKDLDKDTVSWAPNFDDRFLEPTVLPAKFPNLLVNGANGISAGYATNIPPHNLIEIIDATIKRIDSPNCYLDSILDIVKGPDFPTGAVAEGKDGIKEAFKTGRGKVIITSKYEFKKEKGKEHILVTEIPYDVNKATLVNKIDSIRIDKKIDGIAEVRDETDRDGLRIVIDLKNGVNKEVIINYLLKNTELQISYNYNMVAIVNRTPCVLGILEILDAYIAHQREVIIRRTNFDLAFFKKRFHIVEGLIKAISILDEVIKTIRSSKNKSDAKENLVKSYDFTEEQAEAIVMLQLYKLTNTDITELEEECKKLQIAIKGLEEILSDEEKLKQVMKMELKYIKKEYGIPRKTAIKDEITEIKVDTIDLVSKDDFIVCISKAGYVKKVSLKSFSSCSEDEVGLKELDYLENMYKINNLGTIIIFTNLGNYLYLPVREIAEFKYKDIGNHISNYIKISDGEKIIRSVAISDKDDSYVTIFTKLGMVKRVSLSLFEITRYTKPITCIKLKENDEVIDVSRINEEEILTSTKNGLALKFNTEEVPLVGLKTSGVKLMNLSSKDEIISAFVINPSKEFAALFTDKKTAKRIKLSDIPKTTRAKKGSMIIKSPKSKEYSLFKALNTNSKIIFKMITDTMDEIKSSEITIMDKYSVGSTISKKEILDVFEEVKLKDITIIEQTEKENLITEEKLDKKPQNLTMSDFFEEFKL